MAIVFFAKTLIDGSGRDPIQNAALVIKDGRISFVGSRDRVSINTKEDEVVDVEAGVLMPGLIDCHCHIFYAVRQEETKKVKAKDFTPADTIELIRNGLEGAKFWLSQGVTTIRNVCDEFDYDIGLRDLIAQGKVEGPRIFASGKPIMISGRPLYHGLGHEVATARLKPVELHVSSCGRVLT